MKSINKLAPSFAMAFGLAFAAAPVQAATMVDINATDGGVTVASGSFSFADGSTGLLGYSDLTSFELSIASSGSIYTLADVLALTDYVHFAYDVSSNTLLNNPNTSGFAGSGFNSLFSAINNSGTFGFFFVPPPSVFGDYTATGVTNINYDAISLNVTNVPSGVPEPGTWAMLLIGMFGIGAAVRTAKRKQHVSVSYA